MERSWPESHALDRAVRVRGELLQGLRAAPWRAGRRPRLRRRAARGQLCRVQAPAPLRDEGPSGINRTGTRRARTPWARTRQIMNATKGRYNSHTMRQVTKL